jgi:hypothetical protein
MLSGSQLGPVGEVELTMFPLSSLARHRLAVGHEMAVNGFHPSTGVNDQLAEVPELTADVRIVPALPSEPGPAPATAHSPASEVQETPSVPSSGLRTWDVQAGAVPSAGTVVFSICPWT